MRRDPAGTAVVIVAHGSRRPETPRELAELAAALASAAGFGRVFPAFLEINEPSIPDGLRTAIAGGAVRVLVLPWFLNTGRHLAEDIPRCVAQVRAAHPDVEIEILPHIGGHPGIVALLAEILRQAG